MAARRGTARKLGGTLESCTDRLVGLVKGERQVALQETEDRAPISPIGDWPFAGCNPHSTDRVDH